MSDKTCGAMFFDDHGFVRRCNYFDGVDHIRHAYIGQTGKETVRQTAQSLAQQVLSDSRAEFERQAKDKSNA